MNIPVLTPPTIPYHLLLRNLRPRNKQRLFTREVRNVGHDLGGTRLNRLLKRTNIVPVQQCLSVLLISIPSSNPSLHAVKGGLRRVTTRRIKFSHTPARESLRTPRLLDQRHVRGNIIVVVECAGCRSGVEDGCYSWCHSDAFLVCITDESKLD